VENLSHLLDAYSRDSRIAGITEKLKASDIPTRILSTGMVGAQECFVLSALKKLGHTHHVLVATDKEEAAYIQNTLDNINEDRAVSLFPDSFKRPLQFEELDAHNILQRRKSGGS